MIDWTQWPLLQVRADDLSADEARDQTAQALSAALERDEPFAAVVDMPPPQPVKVRGAVGQMRMVRRLRPGLAARCRGLAFVLSADAQREHAKLIKSGAKVWGCPVHADADSDAARGWARQRLANGGS
jgi:hypothetical protein